MGPWYRKGVVEAGRILYAVQHMPGSCLGMVAPSVKRCQTNILPSALVHLEEWGYKRDVHYIVGKTVEGAALAGTALPANELGEYSSLL